MKNSRWSRVIKRLARYNIGETVTKVSLCRELNSFKDHNKDLVGTYLNFLHQMNFLDKVISKTTGNIEHYTIIEQIPCSLKLKEVNEWIHRNTNPPSEVKAEPMKVMFYHFKLQEDLEKIKRRVK